MRIAALWAGIALGLVPAGLASAQEQYRMGKVVDGETGRPLRNVTVSYRRIEHRRQVRWWQGKPAGWRTEGDGTFRVLSHLEGSEVVAIDPERGCSAFGVVGSDRDRLVLKLYAGNTVTGVARDPQGRPLAGLQIAFQVRGIGAGGSGGTPQWLDGPGTVTGADGAYTLHGLPPGLEFRPGVEPTPRVRGVSGTPRIVKFEGLAEQTERDLVVERRPGVEVTWTLVAPDGAALPPQLRVTWIHRRTEPAPAAPPRGTRVDNRDGTMEVHSYEHEGDRLHTHTQRAWTADVDPAAPTLTLFWPVGTHALQIAADNWIAVVPEEAITTAAPPANRTLEFTQRARLYVQLVNGAGEPVERNAVRVSVNHTIRRPRSSHGFSAGNGTTDAGGVFELTPYLPPLRHPAAPGTTIEVRAHFSSTDLTFPGGGQLRWTLDELREVLKQGGPGGHVVLTLQAVPPVEQRFKFVDGRGRPVMHAWIQPQLSGAQRGQTNADGTVTLKLPGGEHRNLQFDLGTQFEMDPVGALTVPSAAEIVVPVRRVLQFQIPITVEGQTERSAQAPGSVTITAFDAKQEPLPRARAWLGATATNWIVFVRVPTQAEKIVLTMAGQTTEFELPGGRAPTNPTWTVPPGKRR